MKLPRRHLTPEQLLCTALALLSVGAAASCADSKSEGTAATIAPRPTQFDSRLLEIARQYPAWNRVYRDPHWSPSLCVMGSPRPLATWESASTDAETHGRKLYDLYAKDQAAYLGIGGGNDTGGPPRLLFSAAGQAIVKESWHPVEVPKAEAEPVLSRSAAPPASDPFQIGGNPVQFASGADGKYYRKGDRFGLFIMFKLDPATPDTDQGWVYGTVLTDLKTVTSAGRVASCMECHVKAPHDRLFGLVRGR